MQWVLRFSNDVGSAGRIIPGGGGLGRAFSGGGGDSTGSDSFHNAFEKESQGTVEDLKQQDIVDDINADVKSGGGYTGGVGTGSKQMTMDQYAGAKGGQSQGSSSNETKTGSSK